MVEIVEVIRRSDQGVTQPFICRDENGRQLWVKGRAWAPRQLVSEWICAELARLWKLPVADYSLVSVSSELIDLSAVREISSLGSGIGFGSVHAEGAVELDYADVEKIDEHLRAEILLFDYWINNGDRVLGSAGGNPNLLWQPHAEQLVIIDHNSAFAHEFSNSEFFQNHVFRDSLTLWSHELRERQHKKLLEFLDCLPDIWRAVPEEWFADDELTGFSAELNRMKNILHRVKENEESFWKVCL